MKPSETKNAPWESAGSNRWSAVVDRGNSRAVVMSLLAMIIDVAGCEALIVAGIPALTVQISAFIFYAVFIFALNSGSFLRRAKAGESAPPLLCSRWLILSLLALLLRASVQLVLIGKWHWAPQSGSLIVALSGDLVFVSGLFLFVFPYSKGTISDAVDWPVLAIGAATYILLIKLIFLGYVNLIPEEAYYWNYAQHLDLGYLDHPPMVAWLIWLFTSLLNKSEFAVRLPAVLCWFVATLFMVRLTLNLSDRAAAYRAALLLSVLPIYFGLGFFMTPDAPLFAAWAACLYFLERALVGQQRQAWWWLGVWLGLGMLSKYPIALLGGGILIFLAIDRNSRSCLLRPEPYIAGVIALLLFSPVLLWNMRNNWVSFAFQGTGRWSGSHHFGLHVLFGSILLLLTPTGFLAVTRVFWPGASNRAAPARRGETEKRKYLWTITFTIAPLSVFVVYSLVNIPKLNWTAPVWLAAIPLVSADMVPYSLRNAWTKLTQPVWVSTIIALVFILSGSLYYIALGLPGAGPMYPERLFGEWREFADEVGKVKIAVDERNGSPTILVGMDRNFISSELSFYSSSGGGPYSMGGSHLLGERSLMWTFWFPRSAAVGKDLLMIDFERKRLTASSLAQYFATLGEVSKESIESQGRVVGYFYWRVGYSYQY